MVSKLSDRNINEDTALHRAEIYNQAAGKPPGRTRHTVTKQNEGPVTNILPETLLYLSISDKATRGAVLARPITYNMRKQAKIGIFEDLQNGDADVVAT